MLITGKKILKKNHNSPSLNSLGCTSGIGRETAKALALKGAHIIMANRNLRLSDELKKEIYAEKVGFGWIFCEKFAICSRMQRST